MNKSKNKNFYNVYFSENIDSRPAFLAEKTVFLVSAITFVATFLTFLVFEIMNLKGESYLINLLELFIGMFILSFPLIMRRLNIYVNSYLAILWYIFIILSMYVGANFELFKISSVYDKIVHFYSGIVSAIIGLSFVNFDSKNVNKFKVFVITLSFACLIALFWEICEFTYDGITGDNTQRYNDETNSYAFEGRQALLDTMLDIIVAFVGALITSISLMFINNKTLNTLAIKHKDKVLNDIEDTSINDKPNNDSSNKELTNKENGINEEIKEQDTQIEQNNDD